MEASCRMDKLHEGDSLTFRNAAQMGGDSAKSLVRQQFRSVTYNTCTTRVIQEQPKWSWTLKLAVYGTSLGATLPVGYCTGVVNSPAVVSRASICQLLYTSKYSYLCGSFYAPYGDFRALSISS